MRREISLGSHEEQLERVRGVPVEIALPPDINAYLQGLPLLADVKRLIAEFQIPVRSVHAPHGHLADASLKSWAPDVIRFAESVGSDIVVFHPEQCSGGGGDGELLETVLLNMKHLQDRTWLTVAVETFWDEDCVLMPAQIMESRLPMVLDTSRIPKSEITWIIESYRTHLVNIHLSAVEPGGSRTEPGRQFRPVENDPFCMDLLDRLAELGWNGIVTLEYMPWLSTKSMEDRKVLERIYRYDQDSEMGG